MKMLPASISVILFAIFIFGLFQAVRTSGEWAEVIGDSPTIHERVETALGEGVGDDQRVKPHFKKKIAWFRTAAGQTVSIWVQELAFTPTAIDGWEKQGASGTMLVNSVDERQSISGGISGPIGNGCDLRDHVGDALSAGDIKTYDCLDPYRSQAGIERVTNVAIVTWAPDSKFNRPSCFQTFLGSELALYVNCTKEYVKSGIEQVLLTSDKKGRRNTNLILPALDGGHGGIDTAEFYRTFFAIFGSKLADKNAALLPDNIYLQVWHGAGPPFYSVMDGIGEGLEQAVPTWQAAKHGDGSEGWLRITGVAGALAVMIWIVLFSASAAKWLPVIGSFVERPTSLLALALVLVSLGIVETVAKLLPPFDAIQPFVDIGVGFVATLAAQPIARALKAVDGLMG